VRWFRSVGARLSLALLVFVAGALAIVYLIVVPSLQNRLVNARLSELRRAAPTFARELPATPAAWPKFVDSAAASSDARVVLVGHRGPANLAPVADSDELSPLDVQNDWVAVRAARTSAIAYGTVVRNDRSFAEVAIPARASLVLLLSSSLRAANGATAFVEQRLLWAGLIALGIALALGYGGARVFSRRLRRLEQAAEQIAGGRFDTPVADAGSDEVGQLARAFDRMRVRLAQLENARREFIANASHELRTPLFSLGGFLELLSDEDLDEETRAEFLRTAREQVTRLAKLASDLLDLSRLDAGRLTIEHEPFDLREVAESAAAEFAAVALSEGRALEVAADGDAAALGDPERTLQIVRILLENALVHTPPGTRVEVRTARVDGLVELAVRDAQVIEHPQGGAREVAKFRVVPFGLELRNHHNR
jgi:signal transduction histidine kinase